MSQGADQVAVEFHEPCGKYDTVDAGYLEQETLDDVSDDDSASTALDEFEVDDKGTTEDQESSTDANDIDLAFTDFMGPL